MAIEFLKMDNATLSQNIGLGKQETGADMCWAHKPTARVSAEITPVVGRLP